MRGGKYGGVMKKWTCNHCGKVTKDKRRWCLLWGPVLRSGKKVRVSVCASCKQLLGVYC